MARVVENPWPSDAETVGWFLRACLADHPGLPSSSIARLWAECSGGDPLPDRRVRIEVARLQGRPGPRRIWLRPVPPWMDRARLAIQAEAMREFRSRHDDVPYVGQPAWLILGLHRPAPIPETYVSHKRDKKCGAKSPRVHLNLQYFEAHLRPS